MPFNPIGNVQYAISNLEIQSYTRYNNNQKAYEQRTGTTNFKLQTIIYGNKMQDRTR